MRPEAPVGARLDLAVGQSPEQRQIYIQHELAKALAVTSDLRFGVECCLEAALALVEMDAGAFYLRDERSGELRLVAQIGFTSDYVREIERHASDSSRSRLVQAGLPVYVDDAEFAALQLDSLRREGLRAMGLVPLCTGNESIGCLKVASRKIDSIPAAARLALETLAAHATQAVSRLQAEAKLHEERARLQNVIEGTRAGTWEWDIPTGVTIFNEVWAQMLGYTLAELGPTNLGTWTRFAHPDDAQRTFAMLQRHFAGEIPYYENVCRMRHRNGHWIWVLDRGRLVSRTADGKPWKMIGAHTDFSAQRDAEIALRASEENLHLALDAAQMGVFDWDLVSDRLVWSRRHEEMWGYGPGESKGDSRAFIDRVHPDDWPQIHAILGRCSDNRGEFTHEFRVLWPDKSVHWVHSAGQVSFNEAGAPQRVHGVSMDITQRRAATEEIQKQNGLIRALLDSIPDLIFYKDPNGTYLGCNPAFSNLMGRPRAQIIGKTDWDLFPPEIAEGFREHDRKVFAQLKSRRNEEWVTYPNGEKILLDTLKTPYRGPEGQVLGVLGISRDVTSRNREMLLQQARARLVEFAVTHSLEELLVASTRRGGNPDR